MLHINEELNGIELTFDSKPEAATLEALKAAGYRWHKVKKLWYAKNTPDRLQLAKAITGGEPITAPAADPVKKSVYLLTGEAKEKFIARYSEVKNARDDGTAHQFTRGGWLKYYRDKDYIFFERLGLCIRVDRPGIYNQIWYDDEREDPIKGNNKKAVFLAYNLNNFRDFWVYDWMKCKKDLETVGCCTGLYNERPALLEYKRTGEPSEVHAYFTRYDDNGDIMTGRATAHELTSEEVTDFIEVIDKLKAAYLDRLEKYFKRYEKNIHSSGYWANR